MSEKIYACLLHLYPAKFRHDYGQEALQLFRDRLRHETGFIARLRLWFDILLDLAISLPGQYAGWQPAFVVQPAGRGAGLPIFIVLEERFLPPRAILSGCALTCVALSLATVLLNYPGAYHALQSGSTQSQFPSGNGWLVPNARNSHNSASRPKHLSGAADYRFVPSGDFVPPPIDYLSLTNVKHSRYVQQVFVFADAPVPSVQPLQTLHAASAAACVEAARLDPERQRVLDAVISNLKEHYYDPVVAQQMATALVARQRCGDHALAANEATYAFLLTAELRAVSRDRHLEVVYTPSLSSQVAKAEFARTLAAFQESNCSFKKVHILPHNIGYLRLDAFREPSACASVAVAAMTSLNDADAVIFDLRNNRGGTAEMGTLISSYLFDHPEYLFDPRRVPTPQSWTSSPVPGNRLASKPVFILTSANTISAAEQFTYNLKMLKRATIVGETTAGEAHAGVWRRIDNRFAVVITETRSVNPYAEFDWESTGIQPDISVPASAALQAALTQAHSQLRKK